MPLPLDDPLMIIENSWLEDAMDVDHRIIAGQMGIMNKIYVTTVDTQDI